MAVAGGFENLDAKLHVPCVLISLCITVFSKQKQPNAALQRRAHALNQRSLVPASPRQALVRRHLLAEPTDIRDLRVLSIPQCDADLGRDVSSESFRPSGSTHIRRRILLRRQPRAR